MTTLMLNDITLRYSGMSEPILDIKKLTLYPQSQLAIMGESGSGKTSLIHLLCGLEKPTTGHIYWDDIDLTTLSAAQCDNFRLSHAGLIMQDFHLYDGLSALNNVLLPLHFQYWILPTRLKERALELLDFLGVENKRNVNKLSRGEKQRVAIARALINQPRVIIADEPTASLDKYHAQQVGQLLLNIAQEIQCSLICVTHDPALAEHFPKLLTLEKGQPVSEMVL